PRWPPRRVRPSRTRSSTIPFTACGESAIRFARSGLERGPSRRSSLRMDFSLDLRGRRIVDLLTFDGIFPPDFQSSRASEIFQRVLKLVVQVGPPPARKDLL